MSTSSPTPQAIAAEARRRIAAAPGRRVPELRRVRRALSAAAAAMAPSAVSRAARLLLRDPDVPDWIAYELVHHHPAALATLDASALGALGRGMASWGQVDAFGCLLAGPVWRAGGVDDAEIHAWARSSDRWWRRAALVSTIALNQRSRGGRGDAPRTLAVCRLLRADRDDMVVKAMSWALRALAVRRPGAVEAFLAEPGAPLAARVVREVRNKLETGLKDPGRQVGGRR